MAAGYAIYRGPASNKWCVVELPDDWTREDVLPRQSVTDRWFDTLEEARAELTRRLDSPHERDSSPRSRPRSWPSTQ